MKVAVYTLTRERLDYTKHCFGVLRERAGHHFDHYVVDNGSQDGTAEWLVEEYQSKNPGVTLIPNTENKGISVGSNQALDEMKGIDYDLIFKIDNDCEVLFSGVIERLVRLYENRPELKGEYMLSPKIEGIINQPTRARYTMIDDCKIGVTGMVGGLFHVMRGPIYQRYRFDEGLPLASGQDEGVCGWFRKQGGTCGYVEGIRVAHYETTTGQAERYPAYFERKWEEEKRRP